MNARQFYDAVVQMREAQKLYDKYLSFEDDITRQEAENRLQQRLRFEQLIDDEIDRVTLITNPNVQDLKDKLQLDIQDTQKTRIQ